METTGVGRARGRTTATLAVATVAVAALLGGCGDDGGDDGGGGKAAAESGGSAKKGSAEKADPTRLPGVGDRLHAKIPARSEQVVAVHGEGADSADATVELYTKEGGRWSRDKSWPAHNGKRGWTPRHHEGDKRSPVGVFGLSDAGGVLPDPGAKLPYTHTAAFTPPSYWAKSTRHDFDRVIAIDYNRVEGTSPLDPTRPEGQSRGGSIWLHMDHGSGTSGCVSLSRSGMEYLLRTLDPERHPVVVMGDKASLAK
ncbi:L,D-transpeptidase family protein [Streptomyces sp. Z26]|uniref:L,D-transpeptidase family protein n=1 Tax=Streptomyces sp. Z26 TaxID=2500177 RepID=UPI001F0BEE3E|nr:L,D-transpeptidase family protein [Streptomyces sp. Z26]